MPAPPLSFGSSFWSQDYRSGLEILYSKLEQGVEENQQIIDFLHHRALTTKDYALAQINYAGSPSKRPVGFDRDEGAGLTFTFKGLEAQSKAQGKVQLQFSRSLSDLVELPFAKWTDEHDARIVDSRRAVLDGWVGAWEKQREDVRKLKVLRGEKARSAELAEAEARFSAPGGQVQDLDSASSSSGSGSPAAGSPAGGHRRSMTISERIKNNVKRQFGEAVPPAVPEKEVFDGSSTLSPSPPASAGPDQTSASSTSADSSSVASKVKEKPSIMVDTTFAPPAASAAPPTLLLAGLSLPAWKATELIDSAREQLALRTIHLPLLGEYTGCFTGYELVGFLEKHVEGFGGSEEMARQAAQELVETLGIVRRVVAVGKGSWGRDEEYYQFTDKGFRPESEALRQRLAFPSSPASPLTTASAPTTASSLLARSGSILSATFGSHANGSSAQPSVPLHVRARHEADHIEGVYRTAVRKLDRTRMRMEEVVQDGLGVLQRWEADRLAAIRTVLREYQRLVAALPAALQPSFETSDLLLDAYSPAADLDALIQCYRTGNFRPQVDTYEPFADGRVDVVFGGDVFRWAESVGWKLPGEQEQDTEDGALLPPVVRALLARLTTGYAELPDDDERRKTWIYEVPLHVTHGLRDALVSLPDGAAHVPDELLKRDLPVIAATLRLWLLELGVPLGPDYDDVKAIYPSVGGDKDGAGLRVEELKSLLSRIPKIRLVILDGVVGHLRTLVNETSSAEPDETYISKLGHSLGRAIVRPDVDTSLSIEDRAPSVFVADLIKHHAKVFPGVIAARRAEVDKPKPVRKNTRPIDRRPSRSMMSDEERANVQAQLIAGGAKSPGLPGMPPSPGRPYVPRNENSARQETDEQIRERVETSKRISLSKLRVQKELDDELPPGFVVQPPTPVGRTSSKPFEEAASQDKGFSPSAADSASAPPVVAPPLAETEDQPFAPPREADDDDRPPSFKPLKDDEDEKPFSPPSGDAGADKAYSPPADDTAAAASDTVVPRKASADRKPGPPSIAGPRGPRVGGPRGARLATPSGPLAAGASDAKND